MEHELKIILGSDAHTTKVFVDDCQIGLIEDVKIHVSASDPDVNIEITIPNLLDPKIDPIYYQSTNLMESFERTKELLGKFPYVKVVLADLF